MTDAPAAGHVGILELGNVCERQQATALGWFEALGAWVTEEAEPALQRLWAEAGHRHAWHASLWGERRPRIPPDIVLQPPAPIEPNVGSDRVEAYRSAVAAWREELETLRSAIEPDLDPSTHRVISLVDRDLAELSSRLP